MKVLFVASECVPFSKTGGLADVVGALPKEIKKSGVDVRVHHAALQRDPGKMALQNGAPALLLRKPRLAQAVCGIEKLVLNDITYYFVTMSTTSAAPTSTAWAATRASGSRSSTAP